MNDKKRPHINKMTLLKRLRDFLGGMQNSPDTHYRKKEFQEESSQVLTELEEALIKHTQARAEYRQATEKLHAAMYRADSLLKRLDSWAYLLFGKNGAELARFGKRPHRKTGPKGPHKSKGKREDGSEKRQS